MIERFIRCRQCNHLLPVPLFFGDFENPGLLPGVEWSEEDADSRREFAVSHANHPREELRIDPETIFSEKPSFDPVKTSYFEATNGRRKFLIKRTKPGLAHPAKYEILSGQMEISNRAITIQEDDLRRQIAADPGSQVLSAEKVSVFIETLREEVAGIPPHRLCEAIGATSEGDSSRLMYAALKEERWAKILDRCARNFRASELEWLREFVKNHREPGEVLSLLVHRGISFQNEEGPSLPNS